MSALLSYLLAMAAVLVVLELSARVHRWRILRRAARQQAADWAAYTRRLKSSQQEAECQRQAQ